MRRLNDERGAIAAVLVLTLPLMLGVAALVTDASRAYQQRRELQNGADAAALAVAENCAHAQVTAVTDLSYTTRLAMCANATIASASTPGSAQRYAASNAAAGHTPTATIDGPFNGLTAHEVTVRTNRDVSFIFGPVLASFPGEFDGRNVTAAAKAIWGPPETLPTVPVAAESSQYVQGAMVSIDLKDADQSGAFSWVDALPSGCAAEPLAVGDPIQFSDPGNGDPSTRGCTPDDFKKRIVLPIYGNGTGTGNGATYTILGFAALDVTGFHFTGGPTWCWQKPSTLLAPPLNCSSSQRAIWGQWVSFVAVGSPAASGTPSFGTVAISLVNVTD